jgi:hypothetical protein
VFAGDAGVIHGDVGVVATADDRAALDDGVQRLPATSSAPGSAIFHERSHLGPNFGQVMLMPPENW